MGTNVDDMNLVTSLQAGDMSALETVMERHAARTYRLALAITRNHADAEEVIQDVFLNVFRKIATFEGRAACGTWIYRITANLALRKRGTNRPSREEPDAPDRADPSPTPEEHLLARETRAIIGRLVDGLPASYRAVIVLRDFQGLSTGEAAHAVGDSMASVKCRLHRGRRWLRQLLAAYPGTSKSNRPRAAVDRHECRSSAVRASR